MKRYFIMGLFVLSLVLGGCTSKSIVAEAKTDTALEIQTNSQEKLDSEWPNNHILTSDQASQLLLSGMEVVVLDIRGEEDYKIGHLPKAQRIKSSDYTMSAETYYFKGMALSAQDFTAYLGDHGIDEETFVLVYDQKGGYYSTRFLWQLEAIGHEKYALLDGGIYKWTEEGYELTMEEPQASEKVYAFNQAYQTEKVATLEDLKRAQFDDDTLIVDTRSIEEYTGEKLNKGAFRQGRIPGSVWLEYKDLINDEDMTILPKEDLEKLFAAKGITSDKEIIFYCQSGVRSSFTTFVAANVMGYENVKNYDGSWIEWSYHDELPIDTGK